MRASSTPSRQLEHKLAHTGLLDLFAPYLFSSQMVQRGKPAPDLFLHAAAGATLRGAWWSRTAPNGVRVGVAAGMAVVGVTAGGHCPDDHADTLLACSAAAVVDDMAALAGALREVG